MTRIGLLETLDDLSQAINACAKKHKEDLVGGKGYEAMNNASHIIGGCIIGGTFDTLHRRVSKINSDRVSV
jgi:hypothetical protein